MIHENIFQPGVGFSLMNDDFNSKYGVAEGDTVVIDAGYYPYIELGKLQNVIFQNRGGQVIADNINMGADCIGPKLYGNGAGGLQYGFKTVGTNRFGLGWRAKGDMEVKNWLSSGNQMGIQVVSTPAEVNNGKQNITVTDSMIENTAYEAVYFGYHIVGGMQINGKMKNCIIKNAGNDGIQCRNGNYEITDNVIDNVGINGDPWHSHGVLLGPNGTTGSLVMRNKFTRIGGMACFINGTGVYYVECNEFQSNLSGLFAKQYEIEQNLQNIMYQIINFKNNVVDAGNGKAFELLYHDNGIAMTVNAENNRTSGTVSKESDKIIFNGVNNGPNVVPDCGGSVEIFYHKGSFIDSTGKKIYYKVWKSSTSPTGYVFKTGNYTWYKQTP